MDSQRLHSKDLMLDFYTPIVKKGGKGSEANIHMSITLRGKSGLFLFFKRFMSQFNNPERVSVKFGSDSVFFLVNTPIDRGIPFYKISCKNSACGQLGNNDLCIQIFNYFKLSSGKRAYFNLELSTSFDGLDFYELKLAEVITLKQ